MEARKYYLTLEQATVHIQQQEDYTKQLEREIKAKDADFQEAKALLEQKVRFLESSIQEFQGKERNLNQKLKTAQVEHSSSLQNTVLKYEGEITKLQVRLEDRNKEISELENKLEEKDKQVEDLSEKLENITEHYDKTNKELANSRDGLLSDIEKMKIEHTREINNLQEMQVAATARIRARLEETEKKLRSSEELLRSDMSIWAKDNAILVQKIDFLEQEIEDLRAKREEDKQYYQSMISTLEAFKDKHS